MTLLTLCTESLSFIFIVLFSCVHRVRIVKGQCSPLALSPPMMEILTTVIALGKNCTFLYLHSHLIVHKRELAYNFSYADIS